jgi:hypothetical protein
MSARVRIVRVLENPKRGAKGKFTAREASRFTKKAKTKKQKSLWAKIANRERKKIGRARAIRAASSVIKRRAQPRFLVEGHRKGKLHYLTEAGAWHERGKGRRFASAGDAQKAMHAVAQRAENKGFSRLQVVMA